MSYNNRTPMDYYNVFSNAHFTVICQLIMWLTSMGGALHIGTNRDKTSVQLKVFGLSYQASVHWINSPDDVDEVLKTIESEVRAKLPPKS